MKKKYFYSVIILFFIMFSNMVSSDIGKGEIDIKFSTNNWTSGNSSWKNNYWLCADGEYYGGYGTYGSSTDLWGLANLTGANFTDSIFQVVLNYSKEDAVRTSIAVDNIQVRIYYTLVPNVTLVSPTPSNNSVIGSTLKVNAIISIVPDSCWLQNNRTGVLVNETMTVNGTNCKIDINGLSNTRFYYRVYAINPLGQIGGSETRFVNVSNIATNIILNSIANNTITSNRSIILNWTVNNTQDDNIIVKGYISQNTTANITKQVFYYAEGNLNGSYIYNFSNMITPVNLSQQLWGLYHLDSDADFGENSTIVYDFSGNERNGTYLSAQALDVGKFGRASKHLDGNFSDFGIGLGAFQNLGSGGLMTINAWINLSTNNGYDPIIARYRDRKSVV